MSLFNESSARSWSNPGLPAPRDRGPGLLPCVFQGTPVSCRPVLDVHSGGVAGVSATPAWDEPVGGALYPSTFSPARGPKDAPGDGLPLGVIGSVCREFSVWSRHRGAPGLLCVRVGPVPERRELSRAIGEAGGFLAGLDMDPARLALFFQCEGLVADPMASLGAFLDLKRLGVKLGVELGDVETPPYHFLEMLPVDFLRVGHEADHDRHGTGGRAGEDFRHGLSRVCAFAENLLMDVIVAGVDSAVKFRMVSGLGCRFGQGAYFPAVSPSAEPFGLFTGNGVSSGS